MRCYISWDGNQSGNLKMRGLRRVYALLKMSILHPAYWNGRLRSEKRRVKKRKEK